MAGGVVWGGARLAGWRRGEARAIATRARPGKKRWAGFSLSFARRPAEGAIALPDRPRLRG